MKITGLDTEMGKLRTEIEALEQTLESTILSLKRSLNSLKNSRKAHEPEIATIKSMDKKVTKTVKSIELSFSRDISK